MNILIVGGSGFIGGDVAIRLASQGHAITIGARKPAPAASPMSRFPQLIGDYIQGGYSVEELRGFEGVIFAAGSDTRHVDPASTEEDHWQRANAEATPRFFERARDAGLKRAVLIGSFYPQAAPWLIDTVPYIAARHKADIAVRALASDSFAVCSVNPPYVVGTVPGIIIPALVAYLQYATGALAIPRFAPAGGANFISVTSVSEAIAAALAHGESGKAYLIGDENLSFQEYLERYFRAVGDTDHLPVRDEEHPLFPDSILYAGRAGTIYYEPDLSENRLLAYRRNDIQNAINGVVEYYRPIAAAAQQ